MRLFYRKYGSGPPLIILHGLFGSSDNWVTVARKISEKFTVVLPDLRNHGQSPHSDKHTYDLIASDINELCDDLNLGKFILAGHSMGGKAAMTYALKWPEKLNALIVLDITPFGSSNTDNQFFRQHKEILEAILTAELNGMKSRHEAEMKLARKIVSERTRGFLLKNLKRNDDGSLVWKLNANTLLNNLADITGSIAGDEAELYPVSGFPVIFLRGEASDYIHPEDIGRIRKFFPAAELINVRDAGHWIHSDRPDAVAEVFFSLI